jgi:hypothetical protein
MLADTLKLFFGAINEAVRGPLKITHPSGE